MMPTALAASLLRLVAPATDDTLDALAFSGREFLGHLQFYDAASDRAFEVFSRTVDAGRHDGQLSAVDCYSVGALRLGIVADNLIVPTAGIVISNCPVPRNAVDELKPYVREGLTLAQLALRWILMHPAVTCAIPGAKTPEQAEGNIAAADLPPLSEPMMHVVQTIYDRHIRALVHDRW